jgi:hypothetical protein
VLNVAQSSPSPESASVDEEMEVYNKRCWCFAENPLHGLFDAYKILPRSGAIDQAIGSHRMEDETRLLMLLSVCLPSCPRSPLKFIWCLQLIYWYCVLHVNLWWTSWVEVELYGSLTAGWTQHEVRWSWSAG